MVHNQLPVSNGGYMIIRPQAELLYDHSLYVFAVHYAESPFDQPSFFKVAKYFGFKRQSLFNLIHMQVVGNVTYTKHGSCTLAILLAGIAPGDLTAKSLKSALEQVLSQADANTAVIPEGFLVRHAKKSSPAYGFELLRKNLKRLNFPGVLYSTPVFQPVAVKPIVFNDEPGTDKRMLLTPDGSVRPSIAPSMFFRPKKSKVK